MMVKGGAGYRLQVSGCAWFGECGVFSWEVTEFRLQIAGCAYMLQGGGGRKRTVSNPCVLQPETSRLTADTRPRLVPGFPISNL